MNGILVTTQDKRMRCEIHTCREATAYSIGLEGFRPAYTNVCKDCMEAIVRQAGALLYGLDWTPEYGLKEPENNEDKKDLKGDNAPGGEGADTNVGSNEQEAEGQGTSQDTEDEQAADTSNGMPNDSVGEDSEESQGNAQEHNPMAPQRPIEPSKEEFYICEDCGETFKRPEERMKYLGHRRACTSKAKKEKEKDEE